MLSRRRRTSEKVVWQHDLAKPHTSVVARVYLTSMGVYVLPWPACSPDLNPMEQLWSMINEAVYKDGKIYTNTDDLWLAVQQAWNSIPLATIQTLIDSLPKRIKEIRKNHGWQTRY